MSALMSLKTAMGSGIAWAWSPSVSYCAWTGTDCNTKNQLTALDLSNAGLTGCMPEAETFAAMPSLQSIDLSGNSLTVRSRPWLAPF